MTFATTVPRTTSSPDHHLERVRLVAALLERLGWEHILDASCLKTSFMENVVQDPRFRNQKRLHQLFGLCKGCNISTDMSPQQVLMWCDSLLKQFSVQVRAEKHGGYFLELQNDLLCLSGKTTRGDTTRTPGTC